MTEETKELTKTLLEGFAKSINNLGEKFATKEDLKELRNELKGAMNQQTERILEVLNKYEAKTEKHDKLYKGVKKLFDEEK